MELKKYMRIILKRLWIVILLPMLAGAVSGYVSFNMLEPVYESNTTLYVNNTLFKMGMPIDYSQLMAGEYLVKDYRELAKSRAVAETVIKDLNLKNISPEGLASTINVNAKNETRIIEISVQNRDPKMARDIADKVSTVFMSKILNLMKVENVNIVDYAQMPAGPIAPSPMRNIAIAVFAGLMAAVGIIFLIEYLDDTFKTPEDVEKYLGIAVLGTIPVLNIK